MEKATIGIIGGSGLYQLEGLTKVRELRLSTPFGDPSDAILLGELEGTPLAFLPRHGRGHVYNPSEVPARANIYALKSLGVERIISVNAVGSLREEFRPLDLVVPDQLIDRTRGRPSTFFAGGLVAHVSFADPFCPVLREALCTAAGGVGARVHGQGTYVVMEGPAFSTRAESNLYRAWGASVIGMTVLPEAKLAREAEICYASLSCVTDYDVWHDSYGQVTAEMILSNLQRNLATTKAVLRQVVPRIPQERHCPCALALKDAIGTARGSVASEVKSRLYPLIQKYLG